MRIEAWVFAMNAAFFALITPIYWVMSEDWTGTSALVMTTALALLVAFYLGFTARRMDERPEDRKEGEIAEGAGELGFFPPYSWWPLFSALALVVCVLGVVFGWWLLLIGIGFGTVTLTGFVMEY
ncbi:MAG: cytochrome c oxidase subunit 4, partial [Propionibacteriales bacterium]|nr:cytochrome c oxidase subunit 4 [Propionibacteriales bacterium]